MSETTVLLIRHAFVHNPGKVFYGRLPRFRISDLGAKQANFLAEHLASTTIDQIYSSPLLRARQTAAVVAGRQVTHTVRIARALVEVRTGWMGAENHQLPEKINLYEPPHTETDETITDVWTRVSQFVRQIAHRHAGQTVACFSHGDPIVIAGAGFQGHPLTLASIRGPSYPHQCSITKVRFDDSVTPSGVTYLDVIRDLAPELASPY